MNEIPTPIFSAKKVMSFVEICYIRTYHNEPTAHEIFSEIIKLETKLGVSYYKTPEMFFVNLKLIKSYCRKYKHDFYKTIASVVNHEVMHLLLNEMEGKDACVKFDNIYRKLREDGYEGV
jgi:hypothetical protein